MLNNKKIVVVMPAYNAENTLEQTFEEIDFSIIDEVILVDDNSTDSTFELATKLNMQVVKHDINKGYGGNQKTCYKKALENNADIIIMLHPDYQYSPKLLVSMAAMLAYGEYDVVLASRFIGKGVLKGGMPLYKFIANKFLTVVQNIIFNERLTEYHTGYRAYTKNVLLNLPINAFNDDFVFDNEILAAIIYNKFKIGQISCDTKYFEQASSINFTRSLKYGFGCLRVALQYLLEKANFCKFKIFKGA